MVELLVAVLVMGVGVLGVTGLQMVSLQNNRDALLRSEALQLAYDMMTAFASIPARVCRVLPTTASTSPTRPPRRRIAIRTTAPRRR